SRLHPTKLLSNATSAYVEVEVSWSSINQHAYVSRYETGINGERIAAVYKKPDVKKEAAIRYFNTAHPVFSNYWIEYGISLDHLVEESVRPEYYTRQSVVSEEENVQYNECETPQGRRKVFERLGRAPSTAFILAPDINNINLILENSNLPRELFFEGSIIGNFGSFMTETEEVGTWDEYMEIDIVDDEEVLVPRCVPVTINVPISRALDLQKLLRALLVEPGKLVGNWLNSMRYLGPLREIPPRNFIGRSTPRPWTKGLAAWDILYWLGQNSSGWWPRPVSRPLFKKTWGMIEIVNDWLASDQRLNTGYKVVIERYREVSSDDPIFNFISGVNKPQDISELIKNYDRINRLPEKIRIQLEDKSCGLKLEPHEIGTGISQVLPVVVAAVSTDASLVAIEQPELHIHPALQVRLGDLFIENIENIENCGSGNKKSF
ncbi:MAG TPA: AAA family ATPase, partial [Candidatus Doudnabacteria bacterium]|nr:AAA family ATPase [Candidatus Doudnabacteria bacterium]